MKNLLLATLLISFSAHAQTSTDTIVSAITVPPKLDADQAQKIASEAMFGSDKNAYLFAYYGDDIAKDSAFYSFEGLSTGEGHFGYFVVNKWTGDVWSVWDCKKISTPASRKDQAQISKLFTPDEMKQYKMLSAIKGGCFFGNSK